MVVDTSFVLEMVKRKIQLPLKAKLLVPGPVWRELKKLAKNKGKKGAQAKAALEIIKNFYVYPIFAPPDKSVIILGNKYNLPVLTYDLALARKAKKRVKVKGNYVVEEEF